MKTPEEIKKGLERCGVLDGDCENCPFDDGPKLLCVDRLRKDALAYIQQLETRLAQVERERDAAVIDLSASCKFCNFAKQDLEKAPCDKCFQRVGKYPWSPMVRTRFEWRGVCEENTKVGANV